MDGWNLLQSTGRQKWHKRPPLQPMGFTPGGPSYHSSNACAYGVTWGWTLTEALPHVAADLEHTACFHSMSRAVTQVGAAMRIQLLFEVQATDASSIIVDLFIHEELVPCSSETRLTSQVSTSTLQVFLGRVRARPGFASATRSSHSALAKHSCS